jgi:hypothetical protein
MTAQAYVFGHPVYYDWNIMKWKYSEKRKCPGCGEYETKDGYDPCCEYIDGVVSICCGHGVTKPIEILKK